jgi:hypothetical protein
MFDLYTYSDKVAQNVNADEAAVLGNLLSIFIVLPMRIDDLL